MIPEFPLTIADFGASGSHQQGMSSYGAKYREEMLFQPASSYCEVCHTFKFDFQSKQEYFDALGDPKSYKNIPSLKVLRVKSVMALVVT